MKGKKSRRKQAESIDERTDESIDEPVSSKIEEIEQGIPSEPVNDEKLETKEQEKSPGEKVKERARQRGYW